TLVQNYEITQGLTSINTPTVGASGALFGILVAFAMYWPNTELYLMFIPIPIKAKYAVMGYAAFELFAGVSGFQTGIAHFAHLGGALFGFLLVKYWNKNNRSSFY
ncbi:rhomboid family intramembrane serine protease, partial [Bacteroidia bacterium]|nr:rhomboid family intramembrane serine protease [Bacteroidia bacterium]